MKQVDYSPQAIEQRLRQVEELRKLCLSLGKAGTALRPGGAKPPGQK